MSEVVPAYLAAGTTVILTGDPAAPGVFRQRDLNMPAPQPDANGGWLGATRVIGLDAVGTAAEIDAAIASLHRACVRGEWVTHRATPTSEIRQTRIRRAHIASPEINPALLAMTGTVPVTVTLTTDPHWLAPWGAWTAISTPADAPYHFDIPAAGGEDDALVGLRLIPAVATTGIYVGGWPNPAAGYDYLDDGYTGSLVLDATWQTFSAGNSPVNALANRGQHLTLAYAASTNPITDAMYIRNNVWTIGYNYATPLAVYGLQRISPTLGLAVEAGRVNVPSSAIPEGINGASFTSTHLLQFTGTGTVDLRKVQRIPLDYAALAFRTALAANKGIVYDGDTDTIHIGDADGISYAVMSGADVIRPLRAAPSGGTRIVYGLTATTYTAASIGTIEYRTRARYLSATG